MEFLWVPSHIQLHGNDAADQAASKALLLGNADKLNCTTFNPKLIATQNGPRYPATLEHIFNHCPTYSTQRAKFHQKQQHINLPTNYPALLNPTKNPSIEITHTNIIEFLAEIKKLENI
ncbi:hypothetical protein CHS0354_006687 [Potamilus streckersoni]|uniref:RNase H type-1 domain-containing protein n=1 Tax=Potamilus streckersoni TaxID=2493646 RepID=A0AAE0SYA5_9BIVA|nr:hypothetical protein CHS0354_006687 [Potamilus streckersoni]